MRTFGGSVSRQSLVSTYLTASLVTFVMGICCIWFHYVLPVYYMLILRARKPDTEDDSFEVIYYFT